MTNLEDNLDKIVCTPLWKFDGLPESVTQALDELMLEQSVSLMIEVLSNLKKKYTEEESKTAEGRGNSGLAAEFHMATGMKVKYAQEGIDYIQMKDNKEPARDFEKESY
jgi:hypothetical protein